jgi:hypothetical protein
LNLDTFNSITNISKENKNNLLHYGDNEVFTINDGAYEIDSLEYILKNTLNFKINIVPDLTTLRCKIISAKKLDFTQENSVGSLLGFHKKILPATILSVNTIRVSCDIIKNSYLNGKPSQILFFLPVTSGPGYRISSIIREPLYLPLKDNIKNINNITIRLLGSENQLLYNSNESWSVVIHLKTI